MGYNELRPCRSFESLTSVDKRPSQGYTNGFASAASHAFSKNCDLSRLAPRPLAPSSARSRRSPWQLSLTDGYSDYDGNGEDDSSDDEEDDDDGSGPDDFSGGSASRYTEVDQLLVFGEQSSAYSHTASLDCRNSIDLRDVGLNSDDERSRRESTLLDLKAAARLNLITRTPSDSALSVEEDEDDEKDLLDDIEPGVQLRRPRRRHHHHHPHQHHRHHHHRQASDSTVRHHHHHHHHHQPQQQQQQPVRKDGSATRLQQHQRHESSSGRRHSSGFNFSFSDKWRSAPSLPASLLDAAARSSCSFSSLARANSVPLGIDLCTAANSYEYCSDDPPIHDELQSSASSSTTSSSSSPSSASSTSSLEAHQHHQEDTEQSLEKQEVETMASTLAMSNSLELQPEQLEPGKVVGEEKLRLKRSRAQAASPPPRSYNGEMGQPEEEDEHPLEDKPLLQVTSSTVKTQDPLENSVLEFARAAAAMDANVEQAILQLRREVEQVYPGGVAPSVPEDTVSDGLQTVPTEMSAEFRSMMGKYNASYEQAVRSRMDEQDYPTRPKYVSSASSTIDTTDGEVVAAQPVSQPDHTADRMVMMSRYNASYEQAIRNRMDSNAKAPTIETCAEEESAPIASDPNTDRMVMMGRYNASYEQAIRNRMDSTAKAPTIDSCTEEETATVDSEPSNPDRMVMMGKYNVSYEQAIKSRMDEQQSGARRKLYQDNSSSRDSTTSGKPPKNASYELARQNDLLHSFSHRSQDIVEQSSEFSPPRRLKRSSIECATSSSPCVALRNEEEDQLLENKPIGVSNHLLGVTGSEHYLDNLTPVQTSNNNSAHHQSKSCDDFLRGGDGAWGAEHEAPPLQQRQQRRTAAQTSASSAGIISSPAASARLVGVGSAESLRSSSSAPSPLSQRGAPEWCALQEAATVQPRSGEMSATAAKRLAMSGEQMTLSQSHGSLGMLSAPPTPKQERKKGGLGGFLQRFSKLRFSGRSKVPRSELQQQHRNKSANGGAGGSGGFTPSASGAYVSSGKKSNEPDYIIIPLHAPDEDLMRPVNGEIEDHLQPQQQQQRRRRSSEEAQQQYNGNNTASLANGRPPASTAQPPQPQSSAARKPPLPPMCARTSSGGGGGGGNASSILGSSSGGGVTGTSRRRAATELVNGAALDMAKARLAAANGGPGQQHQVYHHNQYHNYLQQQHQLGGMRPAGLLETDLDAPLEPSCVGRPGSRSLLNLNGGPHSLQQHHHHQPPSLSLSIAGNGCCVDDDLDEADASARHHHRHQQHAPDTGSASHRPHKSMEFLLDKENLHFVKPPENELQKVGERVPSEHELRVQRSLQRLNVPDWYKNSPAAREGGAGFRLKRHSDASQHGGWRALGSKTTSLSSLSSSSNRQPVTGTLLSPSPTPPVFSRWSTSLLNSAGSSPANSARSSFNHRQPYLGWRSQERLANPRTPAERLAHSTLPQLQNAKQSQQQQDQQSQHHHLQLQSPDQHQRHPGTTASTPGATTNQEVRNSIKEVTSAIVHYVQSGQEVVGGRLSPRHWDDRGGARSTSPRGSTRLVWMESSFVGVRPMDSPDTGPASIVDVSVTPVRPSSPAVKVTSPASSITPSSPIPRSPVSLGQHHQPQQLRRPSGGCSTTTTDEDDDEVALTSTNASTPQAQSQLNSSSGSLYLELGDQRRRRRSQQQSPSPSPERRHRQQPQQQQQRGELLLA